MVEHNKNITNNTEEFDLSSEMLQTIFNFNLDAVFIISPSNGRFIDCNQEFLNQTGYSREEVIGHTLLELNFYNINDYKFYIEEIIEKGHLSDYELKVRCKDNTLINILCSARIIRFDGQQSIICTGHDITKREIAKKQIEYHALLLNMINEAVVGNDSNFHITFWNNGAEKMYGYTKAEAINNASITILRPIYTKGQREMIINELNNKGSYLTIMPTKHRDGTTIITEVNATKIFDKNGKSSGYVMVYRDITELKKTEKHKQKLLEKEQQLSEELTVSNEELRSTTEELHQQMNYLANINKYLKQSEEKFFKAFNSNPAPMSLSDGHRWIDVNESYLKLTGYTKEELIGHTPAELNFIDTKERKKYITKSERQGSIRDTEMTIRTKSGEKRIVVSSTEIIELDSEIRFINFIHDITERKERELLSDALNEVNGYINSTLNYDEIMQLIVELGAKTLGAESSVVNIREDNSWIVKFVYNFPNNIVGQKKSDLESPTSVYVANKKEAIAFNDAQNDPRVNRNGMKLHGVASILVAPIILKNEVEGIIAFYHHVKKIDFTSAQIDFANKLGTSLSQTLENVKLFEDTKKSEDRYRTLFDSMTEGFSINEIILDDQGKPYDLRYLAVNSAFERQTGLKGEDIIGKTTLELFPDSEPVWFKRYGNVVLTGESAHFEERFGPLGKWFDVYAFKTEGRQFGVIFTDITDKKKSKEELKRHAALLDVSNEAIFSFDIKEGILSWNHGAEKLYGYTAKKAIGKISHELLKTKFPIEFNEYMKYLVKDKMWSGELIHRTKDDKEIIVETHQQLIQDESGKQIVIETNRDITERKEIEEQMKATMDELKRSNEELERFAYVSSHDLQEPIRMVKLYSQLLERRYKDNLDSDADDFIEYIVEGANRMKQLIDDLLEYSRVNSLTKEFDNVDLEKVLDIVFRNLSISIIEYNVTINHDPLPTVFADQSQMLQVLQNLITNAIKFHGPESPEIYISANKDDEKWIFGVSDNGIGIDNAYLEQIFEVFKRLNTRKEYSGTGIGLSIVKKIISHYGGRIWVESELGKGSTFYFTIPIRYTNI